ncbi:hypothetical protein GCM10007860_16040 [Chitiniphilus shinanonensis]|uniref:DUF475 domain-containing protein n=1 Tax=Chitiniphilus shinanonensis TaxID=553088 RepID=A0ABQ6BSY6_9NEIS|nr:DUF475 domain-containing protein [Chitiniphilus shinanonensis]GLS04457.1 hypothetical protein GCM10007860_16040 [Chitiniphilus shinanonensis]
MQAVERDDAMRGGRLMWRYFRASAIVAVLGLAAAWLIGGWAGLLVAFNLALLETSLSFDNAVVNASILKDWDERWRQRFLLWGMLVAVFGMRMLFPLVIVGTIAGMAPLPGPVALYQWLGSDAWPASDVLSMAIMQPGRYAQLLQSAHIEVMAFGGAFLLMVFLDFFIDHEKHTHWFKPVERLLARLGRLQMAGIVLSILALLGMAHALPGEQGYRFLIAGLWGVIVHVIVSSLGSLMGDDQAAARTGWSGFIYLEVLDASFSFDGVLGAFALTRNIFLIAIGLGIGAMFVRSFTLLLVYRGTLASFKYLEHGAFWAIGALALVMLAAARWHVHEALVGSVAAVLILSAGFHSWWIKRRREGATASRAAP